MTDRLSITNGSAEVSIVPADWESWHKEGWELAESDPAARDDSAATLESETTSGPVKPRSNR